MKHFVACLALCLGVLLGRSHVTAASLPNSFEAAASAAGSNLLGASLQSTEDDDDAEQEVDSTSLMQTVTRVRVESRRNSSMLLAAVQIFVALVLLIPALAAYGGLSQQSFLGAMGNLWNSSPSPTRNQQLRAGRKLAATSTEAGAEQKKLEEELATSTRGVPVPVPDAVLDEIMKDSDLDVATFRLQTQAELLAATKTKRKEEANVPVPVPDAVVDAIMADGSDLDVSTFRLQTQAELLPSRKNEPISITDEMLESFLDDAASEALDVGVFRLQTGAKVR